MYLIFDTETTGLPRDFNAPITDLENWPRLVQLAWQLHDSDGSLIEVKNFIVKPDGFTIPFNAQKIHGISTEMAQEKGISLSEVMDHFSEAVSKCQSIAGHNISFDVNIVGAEYLRLSRKNELENKASIDTKDESTEFCAIPGGKGGKFKWPTLTELHQKLFGEGFDAAHNAAADVEATARCFLELIRIDVIKKDTLPVSDEQLLAFKEKNPSPIEAIGLNIQPYEAEQKESESSSEETQEPLDNTEETIEPPKSDILSSDLNFVHLHCHSKYSVLEATSTIIDLVDTAKAQNMPAVALTDHGNMYGVFKFVKYALDQDIKPIVGCEFNVARNHTDKSTKDNGFNQVLLALNKNGYHNLCKLSSAAFTDGFYYVPRIDKDLLLTYKDDLVATTGGMYGEIPHLILNVGETQAEEAFKWWVDNFGENFYVELIRHDLEEEKLVNDVLLKFAKKYNVKYFASNNVFYIHKEDSNAHDILLCVKDGELQSTPIGKGREFRFGFPNNEYYFKSTSEMIQLFQDLPEAIEETVKIADRFESYQLESDVLLPKFDIPEGFESENDYLRHLTYQGAEKRYDEITDEIRERLDFELETIKNTGYPGYFLIVQDFTSEARKMGVWVGPGRGSAAGSAVAYCIGITNVDPIKYDLLFERFLNPDRVSLPDIDIDFDDDGRSKIIDWVVNKYGKEQVAQIITYGSMAAKSSIRDTARVLDLSLSDADRIAKLVPDISLSKLFGYDKKQLNSKLNGDQLEKANELLQISEGNDLAADTINQARILEGSLRNTGIHACGVIITPDDIKEYIPVTTSKDSDLLVTQYDNSVVESAGLLKMDFLGLKTLTIIRDAIELIKQRHNVEIDPDQIPFDDVPTYELYQRGETNGTFQFESAGMQKHLRALKPDKFEDLIAMNALYRPGPMEYIPNFIARKHGREKIEYDIDAMEENLAETYGITVYQEQVMLLSQKLAGFSKGDADVLRKAMGKKIFALLDKLKPKFLDGCASNGHDVKIAEKVWKDWEAFAAYAFNKSHSTCYSVIAFQTAYLKANYPAEYMAAVLTNNMNDIKKVTFFMEECKRMDVPVLGPDINESAQKFVVNQKGEIRFGLGAIKGVGENAVTCMVEEREQNGPYSSIYDVCSRVDLRTVNKKTLESLALAGGFDSFNNVHRAQYFQMNSEGKSILEQAIRFGNSTQEQKNSAQISIFGEASEEQMSEPGIPHVEPWSTMEKLNREKEVVGIYISGHPLDDFKLEIQSFCNTNLSKLHDLEAIKGKEFKVAGIVTDSAHRTSKKGNPFGILTIEDYFDSLQIFLFSDDYVKFKDYLVPGWFLYVQGKVVENKWDATRLEYKISNIELLSDLKEKMAKGLTLCVREPELNDELIGTISNLVDQFSGQFPFKILIESETEGNGNGGKNEFLMRSTTKKVNLSDELFSELENIQEINYRINM